MKIRKLIAQLTLLSLLISAPAAQAWISVAPAMPAERTTRDTSPHPFELNRKTLFTAQSNPQAPDDVNPPNDGNQGPAPGSDAEDQEKSGRKTDEPDTKPLKPFRPSEEIAAEQAVDFPVDI